MKEINMGKGIQVQTPWLSINEAAIYSGMSREKFIREAEKQKTPSGGGKGNDRCYHVQALDEMLRQGGDYPPETVVVEVSQEEAAC